MTKTPNKVEYSKEGKTKKLLVFSCWLLVGSVSFAQEWVARYNGLADSSDYANAIALDGSGNAYVTGYSSSGTSDDYATIKYNSSGVEQWVARYDGPDNFYDYATAIALDGAGNVYVTGRSYGSGTDYDYATIKYPCEGVEESSEFRVQSLEFKVYPNPFTAVVSVKWSGISEEQKISLGIYDLSGRLVRTLTPNPLPLITAVDWDGTDTNGGKVESGIYFIKFSAGNYKTTKKVTVIR